MKNKSLYYVIGICLVIIIILVVLVSRPKSSNGPVASDTQATSSTQPSSSAAKIVYAPASAANQIRVESPIAGATIHNVTPIKVSGQALGSWFFEGSFPAEVTDAKGTVIGRGIIKSQSNWMTDSFVNFIGEISYQNEPYGTNGYVILKKDNPSGLPQNEASVTIPILFR